MSILVQICYSFFIWFFKKLVKPLNDW
jgi:hypothetical protein